MKWPRTYAGEIMKLKTKEERKAALAKVPDPFKDLVKEHVTSEFTMRKFRK